MQLCHFPATFVTRMTEESLLPQKKLKTWQENGWEFLRSQTLDISGVRAEQHFKTSRIIERQTSLTTRKHVRMSWGQSLAHHVRRDSHEYQLLRPLVEDSMSFNVSTFRSVSNETKFKLLRYAVRITCTLLRSIFCIVRLIIIRVRFVFIVSTLPQRLHPTTFHLEYEQGSPRSPP